MQLNNSAFFSSRLIEQWKSLLQISDWEISCQSISEMQVVDALYGNNPGHEFVGIAINSKKRSGVIYHTRSLQEDDIIHELLHVRFPEFSESEVNFWTNLLMKRSQAKWSENSNISII